MPTQGELYLEIVSIERKLQEGYVTPQIYQKILAVFEGCSKLALIPQLKTCIQLANDRFDLDALDELTESEIIYMIKLTHLLGTYMKPKSQNHLTHWTRVMRQIALPQL